MNTRPSDSRALPPAVIWSLLVLATGITYVAGEVGNPGRLLILGVLLLAFGKGALVILDFMELRHAPRLWRFAAFGWMTLVSAGILYAYLR